MKLIIAVGFAILSILAIEVAQYQARFSGFNRNQFNNRSIFTRFNNTRFNNTRFNNTRFNTRGSIYTRFSTFDTTRFRRKVNIIIVPVSVLRFDKAKPNSTVFGRVRPNDKLIYREEIYEPAKMLKKVKKLVTLPNALKFHFREISAINITDLLRNGKNGTPSIIKGGPGQNNATVEFKSQRGWPMKFIVEFFGA